MLGQSCVVNGDCQFMYQCNAAICTHQQIFPLSLYTILIYVATGLFASLCNVSGNSMGIFKMLILIMLLNYDLDEATGLAQALVMGSALPNFFSIIFKKHPDGHTTLVNYRLLEIIIPCSLLGSVVGSIGQTMIPKLGQIILLVVVFSFFVYTFVQKYRHFSKPVPISPSLLSQEKQIEQEIHHHVHFQGNEEYDKIIKYQKSYHLKDILQTFALFVVFQFISFLFQGKFSFYQFEKCSWQFPFGIGVIALVTLTYVYFLRRRFTKVFGRYRKFNIEQDIWLDRHQQFYTVIFGAFAAGCIQGVLGMGCGTCIMMVLLSFHMNSTAASATSGYQIFFTGSASLLQFYMNGEVEIVESAFFLGICCVIGGMATIALYQLFKRYDQFVVNKILIAIILFLCVMSIVLTVPTVLRILDADGWEGLTKIAFHC